jgi:DNA-binding LacI/PurR family transcriptional regulator
MPRLACRAEAVAMESGLLNIRAVAKRARVSVATVSRTLNRVPTVNSRMTKRVWEAVSELGYIPNPNARALVSGRSGIIGLIVPGISNPLFSELVRRFEDVAIENGYEILVSSTNDDPKRIEMCVRRHLQRNVEGVAILSMGIEQPMVEQLAHRNMPLVLVDAGPDNASTSILKIDYRHGIRQGVQHLAALGHRKIGFISGPMNLYSAQSRKRAFEQSIEECGIRPTLEWYTEGDHTLEGGIEAMEQILGASCHPTAIMCSNDLTAIGALHKSHRVGLRVPHEMSIVGFDDIPMARMMSPPLTSIQIPRMELASMAVKALIAHIEGSSPRREYAISTRLVVRESSTFPLGAMDDLQPTHKTDRDPRTRILM